MCRCINYISSSTMCVLSRSSQVLIVLNMDQCLLSKHNCGHTIGHAIAGTASKAIFNQQLTSPLDHILYAVVIQ